MVIIITWDTMTDRIYPEWATFVKKIPCPQDGKINLFSEYQESQQKDVGKYLAYCNLDL